MLYTFRGIPIITVTVPISFAYVNGDTECGERTFSVVYEAVADGTSWPFGPRTNPAPCRQTGVSVRVCTGPAPAACSDEFTYSGVDVSVRIPIPADSYPDVSLAIAHFVHDGVPQMVSITHWYFESGGYPCSYKSQVLPLPAAVVSEVAHIWPTIHECSPPGQDVHVTFDTLEFGELHATFQWTGGDVNYDVDTGASLPTPSPSPGPTPPPSPSTTAQAPPTPTASATSTPAALPQSGGPPAGKAQLSCTAIAAAVFALSTWVATWFIASKLR